METNKVLSFAEILRIQTDAFIDILKKQNDFFTETLKTNSNAAIELLKKAEEELERYRNPLDKKATRSETLEIASPEADKNSLDAVYFDLLDKYLKTYDIKCFLEIIEKYPGKVLDVLKATMYCLPKDIEIIADNFGFADLLDVIKERKRKIELLKAEKSVNMKKSYADLCDDYQDAFVKKRPTLIKRFIKQAYVIYPDQFESFLSLNMERLPKNFDDVMDKIKRELKEKPLKKDVVEATTRTARKKHVRIDYKNIAIPELVDLARNYKTNQRQFIQRCTWGLEKAHRSENDRIAFITQAKA